MKRFAIVAGLLLGALGLPAASPISVTSILSLSSAPISTQLTVSGLAVAMTGSKYVQGVMNVPTTPGGTAIPVSALANLGYAMLVNLDTTNYVQVLSAVSGTVVLKLLPGDVALFRFDSGITAPALLAHTGTVNVQYLILEN
jgi:hypothetical protein